MLENPDPTISYPTGKLSCKFKISQCQLCQVGFPTLAPPLKETGDEWNPHMRDDREVIEANRPPAAARALIARRALAR
jgi:hypothetical protein